VKLMLECRQNGPNGLPSVAWQPNWWGLTNPARGDQQNTEQTIWNRKKKRGVFTN
jgi:hypothetical protein